MAFVQIGSWEAARGILKRGELVRRLLIIIMLAMAAPFIDQDRSRGMQEDILKVEKEFGQAIIKNDSEAIGRFLADDWIIIDRRWRHS